MPAGFLKNIGSKIGGHLTSLKAAGKNIDFAKYGRFAKEHPEAIRPAVIGAAGVHGYTSSTDDATFAQKIGRSVAYMAGAGYLYRRDWSAFGKGLDASKRSISAKDIVQKGNLLRESGMWYKQGARDILGNWNAGKSMIAGAMYGMASEDVSITEGALGGGFLHLGTRMATKGLYKNKAMYGPETGEGFVLKRSGGDVFGPKAQRSFVMPKGVSMSAKERALELKGRISSNPIRRIAGAGLVAGTLTHSGHDNESLIPTTMLTGAAKGIGVGGGVSLAAKGVMAKPEAALMGGAVVGAGIHPVMEITQTARQGRMPGIHDTEADGDLALALHNIRHGY